LPAPASTIILPAMRPPRSRSTATRRVAEEAGRRGERLAAWWLRLKGWQILDRRVRTPVGEVDLIARRGTLVAFVEVKTRRTPAELDAAIDERRLARVAAAAEVLMPRYATAGEDIRVDVILLAPGTRPRHIENAWIGY
jgi:putative endonuclease